jgi:hypothetical protein
MFSLPFNLSKPSLNVSIISGALVMAVLPILLLSTKPANHPSTDVSPEIYKKHLQGQVDDSNGAPISGRNPADQQQISLNSAASKPNGASKTGNGSSPTPGSGQTSADGIGSNGCYVDYGIQGQQCLAAHAATNGVLTCDGVRGHGGFPNGIKVTGTDRYHLDTNHDGIACDSGD